MKQLRKTKIVATIGPSSSDLETLKKMIQAGLNVARLNFSHGSHEDHLKVIRNIRTACKELHAQVSILQDLQGPKVRVGKFKKGFIELKSGQNVIITTENVEGEDGLIPTDVATLAQDLKTGDKVLLDDGLLQLKVLKSDNISKIQCEVIYGGILKDRKGINLPGTSLSLNCMTEKDLADLRFGLEHGVDYVALSFVRSANDIKSLRKIIQDNKSRAKVIAKIEMTEAVKHLREIVKISDGIMVARGDLAIEVGPPLLPGLQKKIIKESNHWKRPVITATQMLDSMVNNPMPTRAEVTDVANAILDGTDAVMLSAESASGKYPVKCIETMNDIAKQVEKDQVNYFQFKENKSWNFISEAIAESACVTAKMLNAKAIICLSTTGKTASFISSFRPKTPVISVSHKEENLSALHLIWGLYCIKIDPYTTGEEAMAQVEKILLKNQLVKVGDKLVLTLGYPVADRAKTNALRVHIVRDINISENEAQVPLTLQT